MLLKLLLRGNIARNLFEEVLKQDFIDVHGKALADVHLKVVRGQQSNPASPLIRPRGLIRRFFLPANRHESIKLSLPYVVAQTILLPPLQIIGHFSKSKYIVIAMYLDMGVYLGT